MALVEIRDLVKTYRAKQSGVSTPALQGVSLELEKGSFTALMGPSGAGKSTLLNCLATIDRADSGEIRIRNRQVHDLRGSELSAFRTTELGFIFQESSLLETLSVAENIMLPLTLQSSLDKKTRRDRVRQIAEDLGIADILDRYPVEVSGGQAQRAAVARALVGNPALILADEPTGALDSKNARDLLNRIQILKDRYHSTILLVTHDPLVASFGDRVICIKDGRLFSEVTRSSQPRETLSQGSEDLRQVFFNRIIAMLTTLEQGVV
ncbi:ABC transporter ATP-binding protein [Spirochaeta lutea]|uniref:ABC transporter domain-containing protein n=1 Tax=Spirochaeta lutea TaxID=1480694 RepID=A0A098QXM9_9SPIO|nr:ABC transporter ATP-binding protein [Spirochaeta lutea]KGE71227.1 hypothetical protein DC28_12280 [Spirochaeta lutea]